MSDIKIEDAKKDLLGGFEFGLKTFRISCENLQIVRVWAKRLSSLKDEQQLMWRINGIAKSGEDGVCVIGGKEIKREFELIITSDEYAKESWDWHKANEVSHLHQNEIPEQLYSIKKRMIEVFSEKPPTATLGNYDSLGWQIECNIPDEVFDKIEIDLAMNLIETISISIRWQVALVDNYYTQMKLPTNWGMIRLRENSSPEPLMGHVVSVSWLPKKVAAAETKRDETANADLNISKIVVVPEQQQSNKAFVFPKSIIIALWLIAFGVLMIAMK